MRVIEVLVDGLDHPECVCWDPSAEVLWAGGEAGQLYRVELAEPRAGRWHLSLVESELRGAPLHYPTRWTADA